MGTAALVQVLLAAPTRWGQAGGPGQGCWGPRSSSSQGVLAIIFPRMPEGTLKGSDPAPLLPSAPAAVSDTKEEAEHPNPPGHRNKRFHLF